MAQIIKDFTAWCRTIAAERYRKKVLRHEKEAKLEAQRRIQVREFGGELYFSFDNIPLLHARDLTPYDGLGTVVRNARATFADYRITQELA